MQCPKLNELPKPPPGKTGWPWTEESLPLNNVGQEVCSWPRVSIVTPSYNQGQYLEETIRSVLLQGYPDLEYIIIDGGSTDGSVEILNKYESWLSYWVSERDDGQSFAINKGFQHATGQIAAYINSDDIYCKNALKSALSYFQKRSDLDLLYGDCDIVDTSGRIINHCKSKTGGLEQLLVDNFIYQPSAFYRLQAWKTMGGLNVNLHFILDYDLWIRMMMTGMQSLYVPLTLSQFRYHDNSKSGVKSVQFGYEYLAGLDRITSDQKVMISREHVLKAYYNTFSMIIELYKQNADSDSAYMSDILQLLARWSGHLEIYHDDYMKIPRIWSKSLCRIGENYCLSGQISDGKRFFSMAVQVNEKPFSMAIPGWIVACMGVKSFKYYAKALRIAFKMIPKQNFFSSDKMIAS